MVIILNELSLSGQFVDLADFFGEIRSSLKVFDVLKDLAVPLYKNHSFFNCGITPFHSLADLLKLKGNDEIRKLRNQILDFSLHPPYWQDAPRHNCLDTYICEYTDALCEYGLAEAAEYDKVIFSFPHIQFSHDNVLIKKNNLDISLFNLYHFIQLQKWLLDCIEDNQYTLEVLPGLFPRISLSSKVIDANKIEVLLTGLSQEEKIITHEQLGKAVAIINGWLFSQRCTHLNNRTIFHKNIQNENYYLAIDTQHGTFELHRGRPHLAEYNFKGENISGPVEGRSIEV